MVDYELSDLFKKQCIDKQIEITYDGGTITNSELFAESMQLTESLCSDSELRFGACESSVIKFKIANVVIPLFGKWITVIMYLDGNRDIPFILGRYKVASDKPTADRSWRDIVAYDSMYDILNADVSDWYNTILPNADSTVSMKTFRTSFIQHFGLEQEEIELVNDNMVIDKTIEPSEISGKDIITAICEINGCFGHIARNGKFKYIYLPTDDRFGLYPRDTLYPDNNLYPRDSGSERIFKSYYMSCEYEDFMTHEITKLQIRQEENDIGCVYGTGDNTYIIEDNFLVYGKTSNELDEIAKNLFPAITDRTYRPANVKAKGNPCYEVGDAINVSTKQELVETFILSRTLTGIQALRDTYSAKGKERYDEKVNSVNKSIIQLKGKTNKIIRNVEENRQEMLDITEGLHSMILQNANQIVMKVDSTTGEIVLVELSVSPKKGSAFKVKAKNINMTAEETISFMAGGDLNLTGKNIKISSNNFSVNKNGDVVCRNITAWGISGNAVNQFNKSVDDSEALRLARQAIAAAQSAANTAQSAANTAAEAAKKAQSTADGLAVTVKNINETIIPDINSAIQSVSNRVAALENK